MDTSLNIVFLLGLAFLFTHELDAIDQHEWRFFFPWLEYRTGYRLFAAAHIPLFMLICLNLPARNFQIGFDLFVIVHVGLHWWLRDHPRIEFKGIFSWVMIIGAGMCGAGHLALLTIVR